MSERDKFELFVFDWDGTVMDTVGLIAMGICQACEDLGYTRPSLALARSTIGLGWREIIERACPQCPPERFDDFHVAYRRWYLCREKVVPVVEHLDVLLKNMAAGGQRLAVATGKSRAGLERVFAQTGLGRYFEETITADEAHNKPHPEMLELLAVRCAVPMDKMVMIGDSTHDLLMARNAGCASVGVLFGAGSRAELEALGPLGIAESTEQLAHILGVERYL